MRVTMWHGFTAPPKAALEDTWCDCDVSGLVKNDEQKYLYSTQINSDPLSLSPLLTSTCPMIITQSSHFRAGGSK